MVEITAEQVAQDIKALGDSVTVIDAVLAQDVRTEEDNDTLDRNVRHIQIMLAKDYIKESGADLNPFEAAVEAVKEANPYPPTV
jgi:hypothetical protein